MSAHNFNSILTPHSKATTAIPDLAPLPARPMKCSLPMLLANKENPICKTKAQFPHHNTFREREEKKAEDTNIMHELYAHACVQH